MPHTYIDLTTFKGTGAANINGTAYDTRLRVLHESIAAEIDRYVNRTFQPRTGTMFFSGDGGTKLLVPDLISLSNLDEDNNMDGTFDTAWAANDYFLWPFNAEPTDEWGRAYTMILVSTKSNGSQDVFMGGRRNYRLIGTWGYNQYLVDTGRKTSASIDSTATSIDLNGTAADKIEPGYMVKIDSERIYVTSASGTNITVTRAMYGSTGATHTATTTIDYYSYPGPVREAALIQGMRIWKRKDSAFANEIGVPEAGQMIIFKGGLDGDVKLLLNPYRKMAMGVGNE